MHSIHLLLCDGAVPQGVLGGRQVWFEEWQGEMFPSPRCLSVCGASCRLGDLLQCSAFRPMLRVAERWVSEQQEVVSAPEDESEGRLDGELGRQPVLPERQ